MTPDEASFMDAIIAAPADDAPRLIFADWLEENGQSSRAEFIRVQCDLAGIPDYRVVVGHIASFSESELEILVSDSEPPFSTNESFCVRHQSRDDSWFESDGWVAERSQFTFDNRKRMSAKRNGKPDEHKARRDSLRKRQDELIQAIGLPSVNAIRWQPPGFGDYDHFVVDIRRGFIETIRIDWRRWSNRHRDIRMAAPIRRVELTDLPRTCPRYGGVGFYGWLNSHPIIEGESPEQTAKRLCELEWSGIEFEVPRGEERESITTLVHHGPEAEAIILDGPMAGTPVRRREDGYYEPVDSQ